MNLVYCQRWEESERGWGQRPDGYSLHITLEEAKDYRANFLADQQQYFRSKGIFGVPDEFTRPFGTIYATEVDNKTWNKLRKQKSIREYKNNYPKEV